MCLVLRRYFVLPDSVWRAIAPLLDCRTASRVVWVTETETLHKELDHMFSSDELPTWLGGQKKSGKLKLLNGVEIDPADLTGRF